MWNIKTKSIVIGIVPKKSKGDFMLNQTEYIEGVHCGDKDCYACGTQRYNCPELNKKDDLEDKNESN